MTKASIIIPCHNVESSIRETLDSVFAQSERDIEIICVNNNSTDGTRALLEGAAVQDSRITVIDEAQLGAACARNAGLAMASGEWLYFLDGDDLIDRNLVKETVRAADETGADVVVFESQELDAQTGQIRPADYAFDRSWLPEHLRSFAPQDYPQRLFNSFQNWPCNKLFRRSFIMDRGIRFQEIMRTEDLLFTCRALSEAKSITLLEKRLFTYRVNNPQSNLQTSTATPTDFCKAFLALHEHLVEQGTWDLYRDSFVNWAMNGITYNLYLAKSFESFAAIVDALKGGTLAELGIADYPRESSYDPRHWDDCRIVLEEPVERIVFRYLELEKGSAHHARLQLSKAQQRIDELRATLQEMQSEFESLSQEVEQRSATSRNRSFISKLDKLPKPFGRIEK